MSDREKVINDQQREIEELEERLAIVLEGQPEIVRCKDCWKREFDNCPFNEFSEFYKPDDDFFCAEGERRGNNDG
jgi:hypothetical protein